RRDKLTVRLSPRFLSLEPGARLQLQLNPGTWSVARCTIEGFAVVVELRPSWAPSPVLVADSGRIRGNTDIEAGPLTLALLDVPSVLQPSTSEPTPLLAASTANAGWKRLSVEVGFAGQTVVVQTARRKSRLGRALTLLPTGEPYLIDTTSTVDVELIDADQWLISCDDNGLA